MVHGLYSQFKHRDVGPVARTALAYIRRSGSAREPAGVGRNNRHRLTYHDQLETSAPSRPLESCWSQFDSRLSSPLGPGRWVGTSRSQRCQDGHTALRHVCLVGIEAQAHLTPSDIKINLRTRGPESLQILVDHISRMSPPLDGLFLYPRVDTAVHEHRG